MVSIISKRPSSGNDVETASGYQELENKIQNAAVNFINDNDKFLPETVDESTTIKIDTLIKNKYLGEIYAIDDSSYKCSGHVNVYRTSNYNDDYKVYPFLDCGRYYKTITLVDYILENEEIVTKDDGLYKLGDTYRYKGDYPNNYISLGGAEYRIISIDSNNVIKLIKTTATKSKYIWDDRYNSVEQKYVGITNYDKSRMKDNLNYILSNDDEEAGEVFFTDEEKSYFVFYDFCNGNFPPEYDEINLATECSSKVNQKIGFINPSDYYLASTDAGCNQMNKDECNNYNYMAEFDNIVLMNLTTRNTYQYLYLEGGMMYRNDANRGKRLYIAAHIGSDNIYVSGTGTQSDPYIIR